MHVEVDTGMGRQGLPPGPELAALLQQIAERGLMLGGVYTHFCSSEEAASALTQLQEARFEHAVEQVREAGLRPAWVHAGNTSTIDNPAPPAGWLARLAASVGARADGAFRPGALRLCTADCGRGRAACAPRARARDDLACTCALAVRELAAGETVGYNATYTAAAPMRVALLPVGYADGLRRELSSTNAKAGGWVMLHGRRAPILGRVSMNLTVVDVTAIAQVEPGDEAVLLGPGITADDHARLAGTIAYEILCGIHPCG